MEFSYLEYRNQLCLMSLFMVFVAIFSIGGSIYKYMMGKDEERWRNKKTKRFVYGMFITVFMIWGIVGVRTLLNGGMYLLWETEANKVFAEGYVDSIQEVSNRMDVGFRGGYTEIRFVNGEDYERDAYGADIVISDQLYFAATAGDFQVGDHVVISYLPKSHIIMSIVAAPEE